MGSGGGSVGAAMMTVEEYQALPHKYTRIVRGREAYEASAGQIAALWSGEWPFIGGFGLTVAAREVYRITGDVRLKGAQEARQGAE